jgi:hypothetical protein
VESELDAVPGEAIPMSERMGVPAFPVQQPNPVIQLDKFGRLVVTGGYVEAPIVAKRAKDSHSPLPARPVSLSRSSGKVHAKTIPEYERARKWMLLMALTQLILLVAVSIRVGNVETAEFNPFSIVPIVVWFGYWAKTQSTFVTRTALHSALIGLVIGVAFDFGAIGDFGVLAKVVIGLSLIPRMCAAVAFWSARQTQSERKAAKVGW